LAIRYDEICRKEWQTRAARGDDDFSVDAVCVRKDSELLDRARAAFDTAAAAAKKPAAKPVVAKGFGKNGKGKSDHGSSGKGGKAKSANNSYSTFGRNSWERGQGKWQSRGGKW
jgi:hypothetical protein